MKIGILGAGGIAHTMARTVEKLDGIEIYAIASRSLDKSKEFQEKYSIKAAYGSYEDMLKDDNIDLVYIATPHSHHYEHAMMCIAHNKSILCEKAFAMDATQAKAMINEAVKKNLLITEAIWPRYMPSRQILKDILDSGEIGAIKSVVAELHAPVQEMERIREPHLGGGAMLDLGVYPLNFVSMVLGDTIESMQATYTTHKVTGVDVQWSINLKYPNDVLATVHCGVTACSPHKQAVYGENGYIIAHGCNNIQKYDIYDRHGSLTRSIPVPTQITGYEYEVLACKRALDAGELECHEMPHSTTIYMMELMDALRSL